MKKPSPVSRPQSTRQPLYNLFEAGRGARPQKTLLVMTGTSCDNACVFCSASGIAEAERSTAEIARELAASRKRFRHVEFVGGEFTLRPDAALLLRLCRKLGYESAGAESNGKSFGRPGFAAKLAAAGLDWVTLSIHGASARTHDSLTRSPGSHALSMRGLRALCRLAARRPLSVMINYVVTASNFREMPAMAGLAARTGGVGSLCFSFARPVASITDADFKRIIPSYSAALPYLREAMGYSFVTARSVPPCLAAPERIEDHREKLGIHKNYGPMSDGASCYSAVAGLLFQPPPCRRCALRSSCLGVWKRYVSHYGFGELRPVAAARGTAALRTGLNSVRPKTLR